jgi:thiol-disulfide isomerase/thioredoxin
MNMEETGSSNLKSKVFLPIAILLVVIVLVLLVIKATVQKEAHLKSEPVEMVEGAQVPNFELTGLDGSKKSVGDLPHKLMLVNFWATWCDACIEEMPSMVELRNKYASKGFEILAINVDDKPSTAVPPLVKSMNVTFPIFTDTENTLSQIFDVHAIPLSVMINQDRKILMIESGGREWNDEETNQLVEKWLKD